MPNSNLRDRSTNYYIMIPGCTDFASGYRKIANTTINNYNIDVKNDLTVYECEAKCNQIGVSCGSFEYKVSDARCSLNNVVYQQVYDADPGVIRNSSQFELYTRHC